MNAGAREFTQIITSDRVHNFQNLGHIISFLFNLYLYTKYQCRGWSPSFAMMLSQTNAKQKQQYMHNIQCKYFKYTATNKEKKTFEHLHRDVELNSSCWN